MTYQCNHCGKEYESQVNSCRLCGSDEITTSSNNKTKPNKNNETTKPPSNRCGYEFPSDCPQVNDSEFKHAQSSCAREPLEDADFCGWHAEQNQKDVEDVHRLLNSQDDVIDGAILRGMDLKVAKFPENLSLRGANLADANLTGASLTQASLQSANLTNAKLFRVDLTNANLSDSTLTGANLSDAELTNACLDESDLQNTNISNADLKKSSIKDANIKKSRLYNADIRKSDLSGSDISESNISKINLTDSNLRNTTLLDSELSNADLKDANLIGTNAVGADFSGADLTQADIFQADLENTKFRKADLTDADLQFSDLRDSYLKDAKLTGAVLRGIDCSNAILRNVDLCNVFAESADFTDATLVGASLDDANLQEADMTRVNLENANAINANFKECNLVNSDLEKAKLKYANLERAKLSNSDVFGANITNARLYGARLSDVAVNTETTLADNQGYCVYDPNSKYEYESDDEEQVGQLRKAMGAYHVLEQLTRANTLPDKQSKFFARRQDMRRAQLRENGQKFEYWFAEAQNAVFRHGESFSRVVGWSVGTIVAFAFIFPLGGWLQSDSTGTLTYGAIADSPELMWQSFYHSTLLFLTGTGPLTPTGFVGEVLTTIESLIAPILLALLIFVLGRRAAR